MVNRKPVTIQKIELLQLALSEELANEIAQQTGVSVEWLLAGDPRKPPVTSSSSSSSDDDSEELVTQESFEQVQAQLRNSIKGQHADRIHMDIAKNLGLMASALVSAHRSGKYGLCEYKLSKALEGLENQFGRSEDFHPSKIPQSRALETFCNNTIPKMLATLCDAPAPTKRQRKKRSQRV